ncbi:MAG: transglutaminase domain-containing protein [Deltaproteobacteria bacterium]|nr:transglutaminase domain-containing protein [Deltaproteobacteria bacterium]
MSRVFAAALCLLAAVAAAHAKSRSGLVTLEVDLSAQDRAKETRLWIPYPLSDADQVVKDVRVGGDFASSGVQTDRAHGTSILYAEWPKGAPSRKLTLSFAVERREVLRRDLPKAEAAWNRAEFSQHLKATSLGPVDGEVKKLADRITAGKKSVLEKAKAIYDWTAENTYRNPKVVGCGKGDVCALLKDPGGKCTDISSVFISLCRAAGVPAREIFGIRLGKAPEEEITTYQHCWAEFYVPGYGWVPADPADVRKAMLVENLTLADPKTKAYREYFWGGIDEFRVALARGRDVVLNPAQSGPPLNNFGYPYAEVGGTAVDFYAPKSFAYRYTFRER